eukprot:177488-Chlamydomonas_euryale.AAC.3
MAACSTCGCHWVGDGRGGGDLHLTPSPPHSAHATSPFHSPPPLPPPLLVPRAKPAIVRFALHRLASFSLSATSPHLNPTLPAASGSGTYLRADAHADRHPLEGLVGCPRRDRHVAVNVRHRSAHCVVEAL